MFRCPIVMQSIPPELLFWAKFMCPVPYRIERYYQRAVTIVSRSIAALVPQYAEVMLRLADAAQLAGRMARFAGLKMVECGLRTDCVSVDPSMLSAKCMWQAHIADSSLLSKSNSFARRMHSLECVLVQECTLVFSHE